MRHLVVVVGLVGACRVSFDARRDASTDAGSDASGDAAPDVRLSPCEAQVCSDPVTVDVNCGTGPKTADQLCAQLGYGVTADVRGYFWFQCGGTLDRCPGGWDGLTCPDWCAGGTDCVGVSFCTGTTSNVVEKTGDGSTLFDATELGSCAGYNPGWTIRIQCFLP